MSVTKIYTLKKNLGEDTDKFDTSAYAKDSTSQNFEDDYGFSPKSENEKIMQQRESGQRLKSEYAAMGLSKMKSEVKAKPIQEIEVFKDRYGNVKTKDITGKKVNADSINRILKQSSVSSTKISQRLRKDRIAKKEARVRMYEQRARRLMKAERSQIRYQRKLARVLNRKKKEVTLSSGEMKQMYAQGYSGQNDGNLLHTPNTFTSSDGRDRSNRDNGSILSVPNMLMPTKKQAPGQRQKWL